MVLVLLTFVKANLLLKRTLLRRTAYLVYKGFPTLASNTSAWVCPSINPACFSPAPDQLSALRMQRVDASWQTVRTA